MMDDITSPISWSGVEPHWQFFPRASGQPYGREATTRVALEWGLEAVIRTDGYFRTVGAECEITIEPYFGGLNGRFLAKLFSHPNTWLALRDDWKAGWDPGRYYFDFFGAMFECNRWLEVNKQWPVTGR